MEVVQKNFSEDSPLYNIRRAQASLDFVREKHSGISADKVLDYAGITGYQLDDRGFGWRCVRNQAVILGSLLSATAYFYLPLLSFLLVAFVCLATVTVLSCYVEAQQNERLLKSLEDLGRTDRKFRESEAKSRLLVETVRGIVYTIDQSGAITHVSPRLKEITGWNTSDLIGLNFINILEENERRKAKILFRRLLKKGGADTGEFRIKTKDGGLVPGELKATVITGLDNTPKGCIGIVRDISERLQAESEHQELVARSLSQAKSTSMGELALDVIQEMKKPVSRINTLFNELKDNISNDKLLSGFDESLRRIKRIADISCRLQHFGKGDVTVCDYISLAKVLKDVTVIMQDRLRQKSINLKVDFQPGLPFIYGNSIKLGHVFICLIQNSIEALEKIKGGRINIEIGVVGIDIFIKYADNGPGIPRQIRGKIFDPFFTTKELGRGTGIGLAIVNSVILEHGGYITYEGSGIGEHFFMRLPHIVDARAIEEKVETVAKAPVSGIEIDLDNWPTLMFSAKQIAKILGISKAAVNKRARKENWEYDPMVKRGGLTRFFVVDKIPEPTRTKLKDRLNLTA